MNIDANAYPESSSPSFAPFTKGKSSRRRLSPCLLRNLPRSGATIYAARTTPRVPSGLFLLDNTSQNYLYVFKPTI